jgi:hypothetical protein
VPSSGSFGTPRAALLEQMLDALHGHGVMTSSARIVDHDVRHGISHDEGEGDEWPALRQRIMDADIL